MMGPILKIMNIYQGTSLILAIIIGFMFGFILEKSGFSSCKMMVSQLYFTNFRVLKVMFTAVVVAMSGMVILSDLGFLDSTKLFINPFYTGPIILGGILLGAGFAIGGFCPGTSVVAFATGKIDAMFFVGGVFLGAFIFGWSFEWIEPFYNSGYLGRITLADIFHLPPYLVALLVIIIAAISFWLAEKTVREWNPYNIDKDDPEYLGSEP
jgi:hypothetical protein